jgi:mannose-6-phosphate isomerase
VYESPAPEFRLYRFTLTGEQTELPASGPRIALCTDGGALLRDAGGAELKLRQSESCFLSDVDATVTATGEGGHLRRDCRLSYAAWVRADTRDFRCLRLSGAM